MIRHARLSWRLRATSVLLLCVLNSAILPASAQSNWTWTGAQSSDWFDTNNWSPVGVPGSNDTVNITSGTVNLSAPVIFGGQFNWSGGTLTGNALTIATNGALSIDGSVVLENMLTNEGTVNWLAGELVVVNTGSGDIGEIWNEAGALWNIQCDQPLFADEGVEQFHNAGLLQKSAGTGTTTISLYLNNSGLVQAENGTIDFTASSDLGGTFQAETNAAIYFGGAYTLTSLPNFQGPGPVQFNGGNVTIAGAITNLNLYGGEVSGLSNVSGTLDLYGCSIIGANTVVGTVNCAGGQLNPNSALTVASNGVLNLQNVRYLDGVLTNQGTVNWLAGELVVVNTGSGDIGEIWNEAGALWNIQCDQPLFADEGVEQFHNAGLLQKSAGTGTTTSSLYLNNSGTVEANAGTMSFTGGFTPTGGELLFGLSSLINFGEINIAGNATLGGTVGVVWLGGYVPTTNSSFTVLTYGSYSGMFTNVDLPEAALWATNYSATSFTVTVASINKLAFTTEPAGGKLAGITLAPVVVQAEHPLGDPVAASNVPVTLSLNSGSGTLRGTLTQFTDSTGKATFSDLSLSTIGTKTLLASAPVLTPATSAAFDIVPLIQVQWTSGGFMLQLNGTNSLGPTIIYASTNLRTWAPIYTNPPTPNAIQFLDAASTNIPARFYRYIEQ